MLIVQSELMEYESAESAAQRFGVSSVHMLRLIGDIKKAVPGVSGRSSRAGQLRPRQTAGSVAEKLRGHNRQLVMARSGAAIATDEGRLIELGQAPAPIDEAA